MTDNKLKHKIPRIILTIIYVSLLLGGTGLVYWFMYHYNIGFFRWVIDGSLWIIMLFVTKIEFWMWVGIILGFILLMIFLSKKIDKLRKLEQESEQEDSDNY